MILIIEHVLDSMNEIVSNDYSESHQAIDIIPENHEKSDIIALESGIVENVVKNIEATDHNSKGLDTYGNYVKIKQNDGKSALYAHMEYGSINVNKGDYIEKGAIIGTIGDTGNAYGKHLHLEIKNQNNINENPIETLTKPLVAENKSETTQVAENKTPEIIENNLQTTSITTKQSNIEYLHTNYQGGSIVDALKSINVDSSYDYREILARENNIENYHGSYEQNIILLNLIKEGKLKKA